MNACPACLTAAQRLRLDGEYRADCMACQARRIAASPVCVEAKAVGIITDAYKAELMAVAGAAHWRVVHELVRAWQRGELPDIVQVRTAWSSR